MYKYDTFLVCNYYPKTKTLAYAVLNISPDFYEVKHPDSVIITDHDAGTKLNTYLQEHFRDRQIIIASYVPKFERSWIVQLLDRAFPNRSDRAFLSFKDVSLFSVAKVLFGIESIHKINVSGDILNDLSRILFDAYRLRTIKP